MILGIYYCGYTLFRLYSSLYPFFPLLFEYLAYPLLYETNPIVF